MKRVLVTGLSGTGKSTLLEELSRHGLKCVDTDYGGYCGPADGSPPPSPQARPEWIWRPERIDALLSTEDAEVLVVGGCVENQGQFYPRFDHVVLLTVPAAVMAERLRDRDNNDYGKDPGELAESLGYLDTVQPLLREGATLEVDTSAPLAEVVDTVLTHLGQRPSQPRSPR